MTIFICIHMYSYVFIFHVMLPTCISRGTTRSLRASWTTKRYNFQSWPEVLGSNSLNSEQRAAQSEDKMMLDFALQALQLKSTSNFTVFPLAPVSPSFPFMSHPFICTSFRFISFHFTSLKHISYACSSNRRL